MTPTMEALAQRASLSSDFVKASQVVVPKKCPFGWTALRDGGFYKVIQGICSREECMGWDRNTGRCMEIGRR